MNAGVRVLVNTWTRVHTHTAAADRPRVLGRNGDSLAVVIKAMVEREAGFIFSGGGGEDGQD